MYIMNIVHVSRISVGDQTLVTPPPLATALKLGYFCSYLVAVCLDELCKCELLTPKNSK